MASAASPLALIRRVAPPAIAILVIAYFLGAAVVGENGVMSWGDYRRQKAERTTVLTSLRQQEDGLRRRARLLGADHADPDLAEEMTRRSLGVMRPDEVIVRTDR